VIIPDPLRPPLCLVIDTNVLLLLIGYQCSQLENTGPLERTRVLNKIRGRDDISPDRFDDLWQLFQSAKRRIVTEHVIAETYGLRERLPHRKDLVWRGAIKLLTDPGIEELSCRVKEVDEKTGYGKILTELGPADAGLLYTAEREKATLITDDGQLVHWAGVRSVPAVSLHQIGGRR